MKNLTMEGRSCDGAQRVPTKGIALPVVLLFLLIITIAASFTIRRSTLSEGLTRNQLDFEVARQAAEAALRDAERDLQLKTSGLVANAACARGAERPIGITVVGLPYFNTDCPRGQCRQMLSYYDASNYTTSPATNPQPWWPATADKGGLWGNNTIGAVTGCSSGSTWQNRCVAAAISGANCTFKGAVPLGTFTGTPAVQGVARQPEYLIEYMSRDITKPIMRITARGFGADVQTETVLQSYYSPFLN
ncbi:MAG: hypothetical protein JF606_01040 [Burkholderiales bacterium]|jgi:type IV pilus assembly protein PilX|nr:hypothetical protein [Burkholderiales bacterium]